MHGFTATTSSPTRSASGKVARGRHRPPGADRGRRHPRRRPDAARRRQHQRRCAGTRWTSCEELGERLFVQKIAGTIRPQARAIVKAHQRMGHTVALASAATRFQIEPVAARPGHRQRALHRARGRGRRAHRPGERRRCSGASPRRGPYARFAREHGVDLTDSYGYANGDEDVRVPRQRRQAARDQPAAGRCGRQPGSRAGRSWTMRSRCARGVRARWRAPRRSSAVSTPGWLGGAVVGLCAGTRRAGINIGIPLACDLALAARRGQAGGRRRGEPLGGPAGGLRRQPPEQRWTRR